MDINIPKYYKITQEAFDTLKNHDKVCITCQECFKDFQALKKNIKKAFTLRGSALRFCSQYCVNTSRLKDSVSEEVIKCSHCSKDFIKATRYIQKSKNHFCTRSCSASFNNKLKIRKNSKYSLTDKTCLNCNLTFTKTRDRASDTCSRFCSTEYGMKKRLMKDSINRSGANTYDTIRQNARLYSRYFYPLKCMICHYDKHYEVCHIKDLKDFTREESIFEVNNKTNLVHLCPNCHWEFDHNKISLERIRDAQNKENILN